MLPGTMLLGQVRVFMVKLREDAYQCLVQAPEQVKSLQLRICTFSETWAAANIYFINQRLTP